MTRLDRREFLLGSAALGGTMLLAGCGSGSGLKAATNSGPASAPPVSYGGSLSSEPNHLLISEWPGYEAGGTKAQTYGLTAGTDYTKKFGASSLKYADYGTDDKNLNRMRAGEEFDLLHPCVDYAKDYVDAGVVQPFDTSLLPSYSQLYPEFTKGGTFNGQQYWIPWDWGFGSIMYRKDKVDPTDATGWELFWNEKYKGKISMWDGGVTPVSIAGLLTDPPATDIFAQTNDELERSKELLIKQKPLNKFYWTSEYGNMQPAFKSGDVWIVYAWPVDYKQMGDVMGYDKVGYLNPSQGKIAWVCGFMMGQGTESPLHAHDYVESFINLKASANLVNDFAYGTSSSSVTPAMIKDKRLATELGIGNPDTFAPPSHVFKNIPNRADYQRVWAEVKAS
jgi:spermidine/putrescine transport system substrate-binding protein